MFVYGFGNVISKIIPLLMLPVVTRLMPNSEYIGISDLSNTIISFASSFALMGMYDAMYRLFFEKDNTEYRKRVCSTALIITLCTSLFTFIVLVLLKDWLAQVFLGNKSYAYVVYISAIAALVGATNSVISAPTRMQNKRLLYILGNTLSPVLSYSISIPMLLNGYYVIALPLAGVISAFTIEIFFGIANRKWFSFFRFDKSIFKQLVIFGVPTIFNFTIYWIFNSSDKLMITNLIGIAAAGIYAVASKIGHISNLVYSAFSGGWQFFVYSTMNDENQVDSVSMVYEYLGTISFLATATLCSISYPLISILFSEEYISVYLVAPYLFLSPLILMLYQTGGIQLWIIKKTWPSSLILICGAIVNIVLNYFLIPIWGIEGAAIATLMGYAVTALVGVLVLSKLKLLKLKKRFGFVILLFIIYFFFWRLYMSKSIGISLCMLICFVSISGFLYRGDIYLIFSIIKKSISRGH